MGREARRVSIRLDARFVHLSRGFAADSSLPIGGGGVIQVFTSGLGWPYSSPRILID